MKNEVAFLEGRKCKDFAYIPEGGAWSITFTKGAAIYAETWWRLVSGDKICVTSDDHGHKFGLAKPVDAGRQVLECIRDVEVRGASLTPITSDLTVEFANGFKLQILTSSSGYESFNVGCAGGPHIQFGGGGSYWHT